MRGVVVGAIAARTGVLVTVGVGVTGVALGASVAVGTKPGVSVTASTGVGVTRTSVGTKRAALVADGVTADPYTVERQAFVRPKMISPMATRRTTLNHLSRFMHYGLTAS
jgi:hypothetical protein